MYQNLKSQIKEFANSLSCTDDKPMFNAALNNFVDSLSRNEIEEMVLNETISKKKAEQYRNWLSDYVCKLHK